MNKKPIFLIFPILFLLSSCSIVAVSPPPPAANLYGPNPIDQKIKGSSGQAKISRTVDFTNEELFEAIKAAMLRLGYEREVSDQQAGKIVGAGYYNCGPVETSVTMAIYFQQTSTAPESKFTILMDRHDFNCWDVGESYAASQLSKEIQKVLSTF